MKWHVTNQYFQQSRANVLISIIIRDLSVKHNVSMTTSVMDNKSVVSIRVGKCVYDKISVSAYTKNIHYTFTHWYQIVLSIQQTTQKDCCSWYVCFVRDRSIQISVLFLSSMDLRDEFQMCEHVYTV